MKVFKPKMYQKSIYDINYSILKKNKIKVIIFDLDNTLLGAYQNEPDDKLIKFINGLKKDFKIIVASNNTKVRVKKVCDKLGCDYLYSILKPTKLMKKYFKKKFSYDFSETVIIGDQVVTDIFLGNRLNIYTILVDPKEEKDLKITKFNRFLEKNIMKRIKVKRGEYYE